MTTSVRRTSNTSHDKIFEITRHDSPQLRISVRVTSMEDMPLGNDAQAIYAAGLQALTGLPLEQVLEAIHEMPAELQH